MHHRISHTRQFVLCYSAACSAQLANVHAACLLACLFACLLACLFACLLAQDWEGYRVVDASLPEPYETGV
eukprot:COSAG06_NODE_664_length_13285_cov_14.962853_3_plen_71_part_00